MTDDISRMTLVEEELIFNSPPKLIWILLSDAINLLWRDNAKMHDLQLLAESIRRYGFQEPSKFDIKLHRQGQDPDDEPQGAIKSGNGRIEALAWMESQGKDLPEGLAKTQDGRWAIPLLIGTDAKSGSVARAYAIDANNLTMAGGDFSGYDMAHLWDSSYVNLLSSLDSLPVTVDDEMFGALTNLYAPPDLDDLEEEYGEPGEEDFWPIIKIKVSPETFELFESIMGDIPVEDEGIKFGHLLSAVDVAALNNFDY